MTSPYQQAPKTFDALKEGGIDWSLTDDIDRVIARYIDQSNHRIKTLETKVLLLEKLARGSGLEYE